MPTTEEKIDALQLIAQPSVCEVLKVYWGDETKYYAWTRYDEIVQFTDIPYKNIEARILNNGFTEFEINPDINSDEINFVFDDIDKEITNRFQEYGSVKAELILFFADVQLEIVAMLGLLNQPDDFGYENIQATFSSGFHSRELLLPNRLLSAFCPAIFGGKFTSLQELETNGCPYNRQLGGSIGFLNPDTGEPYLDCPKLTKADCRARLGGNAASGNEPERARYFMGVEPRIGDAVSDPRTGYVAQTKGNTSQLKTPIRVVLGSKFLHNMPVLFWRKEAPDYIRAIYLIGEGSIGYADTFAVNQAWTQAGQYIPKMGYLGQDSTGFEFPVQNPPVYVSFSGTAVVMINHGFRGSDFGKSLTGSSINGFCRVPEAFNQVAIFSDETTYTRQWTRNRVWCLLEAYTNKKWGLRYSHDRFDITSFIETANWTKNIVRFTVTYQDGEIKQYDKARTTIGAVLDPRPSYEQILDICRAGRISPPFIHNGKFHITPIAAVETAVLENAKVFTDAGDARNIVWEQGLPSINFSQTPDEKLVNHIILTYDDAENFDIERPITVDDQEQKRRAGVALSGDADISNFVEVPRSYSAFGVRDLEEAVKLAYSLLWFGEFDEGGIENNLRGTFYTPFEQTLGLRKYDIIKIESALLDGFETPQGNPFEYFRILNMRKAGGQVQMIVQAYNKEVYEDFETVLVEGDLDTEAPPEWTASLDVERLGFADAPYYEDGNIVVPPIS